MMTIEQLESSNVPDLEVLLDHSKEARSYLESRPWCESILDLKFGAGIAYVSVFLAKVRLSPRGGDLFWVVVGDLPPMHFDTNDGLITTPSEALFVYTGRLIEWLYAFRDGQIGQETLTLLTRRTFQPLKPSSELSEMIDRKIGFLMGDVIPYFLGERDCEDVVGLPE